MPNTGFVKDALVSSTAHATAGASDEWGTPMGLFRLLDDEFHFTLDAAATRSNTKCKRYYSPAADALILPWAKKHDSAFLNPPYGRTCADCTDRVWKGKKSGLPKEQWCAHLGHTSRTPDDWLAKVVEECALGCTIVVLTFSRTDTAWWQDSVMGHADEVRLIKGRVHFEKNGEPVAPAPAPSAVVVFRPGSPNRVVWEERGTNIGTVVCSAPRFSALVRPPKVQTT